MDVEVALVGFGLAGLDGVKTVLETLAARRGRRRAAAQRRTGRKDTTAIITAYNEEDSIVESVAALKPHFREVIVANDGSTDRTAARVREAHPEVTVLDLPHAGKVAAQRSALTHVKTPYVGMFDADISVGSEFRCPRLGERTAVALSVVPRSDYRQGAWLRNGLIDQQKLEYKRTMELGRRAQALMNSTFCVSGAAGLFRTRRLRQQSTHHSGTFAGDDLERTLIELLCGGRVGFEDATVQTDVPKSIGALARQRVRSWWPGMWRNLGLLAAVAMRPGTSMRSRLELGYMFASTLADPIKVLMLLGLLLSGQFATLAALYMFYVGLDAFVCRKMGAELDLKRRAATIALSPLYGGFQVVLRAAAFGVFAYQRARGAWERSGGDLVSAKLFAPIARFGFVARGAAPVLRLGGAARPLAAGLATAVLVASAPGCDLIEPLPAETFAAPTIEIQAPNRVPDDTPAPSGASTPEDAAAGDDLAAAAPPSGQPDAAWLTSDFGDRGRWRPFGAVARARFGLPDKADTGVLFAATRADAPHDEGLVGVWRDLARPSGDRFVLCASGRSLPAAGPGATLPDPLDAVIARVEWRAHDDELLAVDEASMVPVSTGDGDASDARAWLAGDVPDAARRVRVALARSDGAAGFQRDAAVEQIVIGPSARNLLANASFEDGLERWASFGPNVQVEPTRASDGGEALKVFRDFDRSDGHVSGAWQAVPVVPGTAYLATARQRSGNGASDELEAGARWLMRVEWRDGADDLISAVEVHPDGFVGAGATSWRAVGSSVIAPPRAERARVAVALQHSENSDGGGSLWFDAIYFGQRPEGSAHDCA